MSSNDLKQVRDYIKTRIAISAPNLSEFTDSLADIGNIPQTNLDRRYHIELSTLTSSPQIDSHVEDDFIVVISIFRLGYNEPVEVRDELLQEANCIRLDLINPLNMEEYKRANDGNIEDVQSVSITPSEINPTNDNTVKIEIELNIRLFFGTT